MSRILVCGGREYSEVLTLARVLDEWHAENGITQIIEGGAPGADRLAFRWARHRGIETRTFPADWRTHGRAAGPIRNQQMLDEGRPDVVIAFPGGAGTASMISLAKRAGVPVTVIERQSAP